MSLMMPERLYRLLPAVYRLRDRDEGEPLRAFLRLIETELERVEGEVARLYDNWFIETCDEWVVPYIGDLLGVRPVRPIPSAGVSVRAYVANTIAYRRRKGTAVVIEQLARDVSGWPASAVEFYQRLAATQHMNHVRQSPAFTPSIRDAARAELADGAFDPFSHAAEVRTVQNRGRFNIPNVGIYLWRLRSYALGSGVPGDVAADFTSAREMGSWWSVHPAGIDSPLFNRPRTEATIIQLAGEENVPGPLRRLALHAELERLRRDMAEPAARFMTSIDPAVRFFVRLDGESVPQPVGERDIYICEIPDDVELQSPVPRVLALDPQRGRIAFPSALAVREVWVQGSYGFPGDIGGGPYDRSRAVRTANDAIETVATSEPANGGFDDPSVWQAGVSHLLADDGSGTLFPTLRAAVDAWNALPDGRTGVIVLMDSLTDFDAGVHSPASDLELQVGERSKLLIVAGRWPLEPIPGAPPGSVMRVPGHFDAQDVRAHFAGNIVLRGAAPAGSANAGACFINGLLLEGTLRIAPGDLGELIVAHSTLMPGSGGLMVEPGGNERLRLSIEHSICASIAVPGPIASLRVADSIVGTEEGSPAVSLDAPEAAVDLARSSFFGATLVQSISATDCIFAAAVHSERLQSGCMRFSYVPPGSAAPRIYRCQPQLESSTRIDALKERARAEGRIVSKTEEMAVRMEVAAMIRPLFVSRRFGDPAYGQLELRCAEQIRTGAESGAEMGAFESLMQPQREANIRDALQEYLPFGLQAGLRFVT